ncbi:hypothetical protein QBC47DRAFT_22207 [Echria macrotheca]|uniref:Chromo domain-containing protein n=1 Tax=Echria macrotheca TaxID=438768 RepID=A0AAJ0BNG0_9PEZI|nr:hypothetical protein QBC47DRAFT_22207 [Echria macrotheca]
MFKDSIPRRSAHEDPPDPSGDDDDISLTSTAEGQHDSDEEFAVETILAVEDTDSGPYYLVEWTGFPLHESTWEPEDHIGDEIKAMWVEKQQKQEAGEIPRFDIADYKAAIEKAAQEKLERHERRNRKRIRLGLPPTSPLPNVSRDKPIKEDSGDDEGYESPVKTTPDPRPTPTGKAKSKTTEAPPAPQLSSSSTSAVTPGSPPGASKAPRQPGTAGTKKSASLDSPATSTQNATASASRRPSTGYEGTARRLSNQASTKAVTGAAAKSSSTVQTTAAGKGSTSASTRPLGSTGKAQHGLKAKKSTQGTGNIFTSGQVTRVRPNLNLVMNNPSKGKRNFPNHRVRNIAVKQSRGKEDLPPPDPSKLVLFDPSQPRRSSIPGAKSNERLPAPLPSPQPSNQIMDVEMTSEPLSASSLRSVAEPKPATKSRSSVGTTAKKKKSVRFLSPEAGRDSLFVSEPEAMDIDDGPGSHKPAGPVRLKSPPPESQQAHQTPHPLKKLSVSEYRAKVTQVVEKTITLGKGISVNVFFDGLPRELDAEWFKDFMSEKTIEFEHACLAQDMKTQLETTNFIQARHVASTVRHRDWESTFEKVAVFLQTSLLGLYCSRPNYNILIYSTKCDDWRTIELLGQEPASPSDHLLRFTIFSTGLAVASYLRPLSPGLHNRVPERLSDRAALMKRFFGLDYAQLLPARRWRPGNTPQTFFLAFPESRRPLMNSVYRWLRDCDPECRIFCSYDPGSWTAFWAAVEQTSGVVIVHELLVWSLRRFPSLARYLLFRNDQYWCLNDGVEAEPVFPSIAPRTEPSPPGQLQMVRLFSYKTAMLLTPSFMVSEPLSLEHFLEWYLVNHIRNANYRLVTPWNFHEYLLDLADEKAAERAELMAQPNLESTQREILANLRGISRDECKSRYVAATRALEIWSHWMRKGGPVETYNEANCPVVFVDPCIDPNDEQSIVNWFGWWSTLRADQYRKLRVIGSSDRISYPGSQRGERRLRIPRFSSTTVNDPDLVLTEVRRMTEEANRPVDAGDISKPDPQAVGSGEAEDQPQRPGRWEFQSKMIQFDTARAITSLLAESYGSAGTSPIWRFFKFPVSWADFPMADRFGDYRKECNRLSDWLGFTHKFKGPYNTYFAFFYTPTVDWDPGNPDAVPTDGPRHPWIGIYRVADPHISAKRYAPIRECELIIWDADANKKFPKSRSVAESSLLDMQRRTIQYVREHTGETNPGSYLKRVWLGGFALGDDVRTPYTFDTTFRFLDQLFFDIKSQLPATEWELRAAGFVPVVEKVEMEDTHPEPSDVEGQPMDISSGDEGDEDTCIIFHPPRGTKLAPGQRTKCRNLLYEETRLARARGLDGYITYKFPSTMEWYADQRAEGRGFEFINFDTWESISAHYGIEPGRTGSESSDVKDPSSASVQEPASC